jgi:hypothetical protein
MRNVLIPTNFSMATFDLVEKTLQSMGEQPVNIILFHAFQMPFFVSDMIRNKKQPYHDLLTDAFRNSCKHIKQQYPKQLQSITFKHLYGNTPAVFRNFVDANDIDLIVYPEQYEFQQVHADSVNPDKMFKKCGLPLLRQLMPKRKTPSLPEIKATEQDAIALLRLINAGC